MSMTAEKLRISVDEINSPQVDERLKQHELVKGTREHYETVQVTAAAPKRQRFTLLYNTVVYMALFGILGGLLGWAFGEVMHFGPNQRIEALELLDAEKQLQTEVDLGRTTKQEAQYIRAEYHRASRYNDYYATWIDQSLSKSEKDWRIAELEARDRWQNFLADMLFFSVSGMMIAICLAAAESVVERNWQGAAVYACVGAAAGLAGGIVVSLFFNKLHGALVGGPGQNNPNRQLLAAAISWGVLGLFLGAAPGLVLRNFKRLQIGLIGGLLGGIVGGALYEPIKHMGGEHMSRLIAIIAIGLVAGVASGVIENVVKTGWVKVIAGMIAGKQFVLYRNPTYIGSSPQSHIYLFKDQKVGRRHAAIHIIPGGYEIEDLPLGTKTTVNGKPITRQKLRMNDKIQVGGTTFSFQEKPKS